MCVENPNRSTHNIAVDMIVLSGGKEYLIAQSDLVQPGYALNHMKLMENAPKLSAGQYTGLYRISCYAPDTGIKAMISPEITGINITVIN